MKLYHSTKNAYHKQFYALEVTLINLHQLFIKHGVVLVILCPSGFTHFPHTIITITFFFQYIDNAQKLQSFKNPTKYVYSSAVLNSDIAKHIRLSVCSTTCTTYGKQSGVRKSEIQRKNLKMAQIGQRAHLLYKKISGYLRFLHVLMNYIKYMIRFSIFILQKQKNAAKLNQWFFFFAF